MSEIVKFIAAEADLWCKIHPRSNGFSEEVSPTYFQDRAHATILQFDNNKLVTLNHESVCNTLSGCVTGGSQFYARDCESGLYARAMRGMQFLGCASRAA